MALLFLFYNIYRKNCSFVLHCSFFRFSLCNGMPSDFLSSGAYRSYTEKLFIVCFFFSFFGHNVDASRTCGNFVQIDETFLGFFSFSVENASSGSTIYLLDNDSFFAGFICWLSLVWGINLCTMYMTFSRAHFNYKIDVTFLPFRVYQWTYEAARREYKRAQIE